MAKRDLFGKEKDAERRAAMEREAADEVERLTRRVAPSPGGVLGGGGGMGTGGGVGPPSELEMLAHSVRERPRGRGATGLGGKAPNPATAFPFGAAMLSGPVGSGFGPGGLNPGPGNRAPGSAVPPGARSAPSPDYADAQPMNANFGRGYDDDEEEMSITEMALADYAARSGSSLEDVAVQVDVESAEEMRDRAMRQFHDRQQTVRRPMAAVTDPFAPAAVRSKTASAAAAAQAKLDAPGGRQRPESAGNVLAARIAARRRQDDQRRDAPLLGGSSRRPLVGRTPPPPAPPEATDEIVEEDAVEEAPRFGALSRLADRRQPDEVPAETAIEVDDEDDEPVPAPTGRLHARQRQETRGVPVEPPPAPSPAPDPNAHLYEALMEERAARLELEAKLEALAAAAAAPPAAKRGARPRAGSSAPKGSRPKPPGAAVTAKSAKATGRAGKTPGAAKAVATKKAVAKKVVPAAKAPAAKSGTKKPAAKAAPGKPAAKRAARPTR